MKHIFLNIFQMSSPEEWLVCGLCSAKVIVDKGGGDDDDDDDGDDDDGDDENLFNDDDDDDHVTIVCR